MNIINDQDIYWQVYEFTEMLTSAEIISLIQQRNQQYFQHEDEDIAFDFLLMHPSAHAKTRVLVCACRSKLLTQARYNISPLIQQLSQSITNTDGLYCYHDMQQQWHWSIQAHQLNSFQTGTHDQATTLSINSHCKPILNLSPWRQQQQHRRQYWQRLIILVCLCIAISLSAIGCIKTYPIWQQSNLRHHQLVLAVSQQQQELALLTQSNDWYTVKQRINSDNKIIKEQQCWLGLWQQLNNANVHIQQFDWQTTAWHARIRINKRTALQNIIRWSHQHHIRIDQIQHKATDSWLELSRDTHA